MRLLTVFMLAALVCFAADNASIAARLGRKAEEARKSGQLVRAYLLYAEAASRDPQKSLYAMNRDGLAPLAKLLATANIEQNITITDDVKEAEQGIGSAPFDSLSETQPPGSTQLQGLPHLDFASAVHSFDLRGDAKTVIQQVALAYGVKTLFDPEFEPLDVGRFNLSDTDFRTAMEAVTEVTETFVFPVDEHTIFVAHNSEIKRDEYEPVVLVTVPLLDAVEQKDVADAANAVRGALGLRFLSWDDVNHVIVIRDRVSLARAAAGVLNAIVLPRAQLSLKIQIITADSNRSFHYGLALPASFPAFTFAKIGNWQILPPDVSSATSGLFAFAAGTSFFGIALGSATGYATYSNSSSGILFESTVVVGDGQTANLHVGDKYPIAQSLYTGASQSTTAGVYNPVGQVTLEDLGLVLKVSPHIAGSGDVMLDVEAQYRSLSGIIIDTIPAISERTFKGSVRLREDQFAILAGLNDDEHTNSRSGLPGLSQIPVLNQLFSENQPSHTTSDTLLLIKPTITRLPMTDTFSPQFLVGSQRGERVVL